MPRSIRRSSGSSKVTDASLSAQTKAELLCEINAYCDSATTVGQVSSVLEAGQIREVQAAAKRSHEERKLIHERRGFDRP